MAARKVSNGKVTFNVIQGHWQWCHSIGHIRWLPGLKSGGHVPLPPCGYATAHEAEQNRIIPCYTVLVNDTGPNQNALTRQVLADSSVNHSSPVPIWGALLSTSQETKPATQKCTAYAAPTNTVRPTESVTIQPGWLSKCINEQQICNNTFQKEWK